MTAQPLPRPRPRTLREATLLEAPQLLLSKVRGLSSTHSLTWLACVPVALFGLGVFNLSAKAAELPELNAAFLANNLWLFIATILVIFMNAGFAMVEAGMCRQKNAVNILAKNLFVFALAVTAYWVIGYSLMYGSGDNGWFYFAGLFFDPAVTPEMVRKLRWCRRLISSSRQPSLALLPRSFPVSLLSASSSASLWFSLLC
jgi:Amt family ammonium transporter